MHLIPWERIRQQIKTVVRIVKLLTDDGALGHRSHQRLDERGIRFLGADVLLKKFKRTKLA